ncbi:MAG: hypothetical protein ACT4P5_11775 [Armatimonadota bacterium]
MSISDVTPEQVERAISTFRDAAEQERRAYLQASARERAQEAQVLTHEADRLRALLGPNDPRVITLERAAGGAEALAQWLDETAKRAQRSPEIGRGDWAVVGRIAAPAGAAPQEGLSVQLVDREGNAVERLQTQTDSRGEFAIRVRAQEFGDLLTRQPEVFVRVTNLQGTIVFTSTEPLRPQPDRVDHMEVALGESTSPGGPVRSPRRRRGRPAGST